MKRPNKRILVGMLLIVAWLGFIAQGSHALFSDAATLAGSTITTGGADLQVSNSQYSTSTAFADSKPGFDFRLDPGESGEKYFFLKNSSPGEAFSLDIDLKVLPQSGVSDLYGAVKVEITPVDGEGVPQDSTVSTTLSNATTHPVPLTGRITADGEQRYLLKVSLDQFFELQGQNIAFDMFFTGTQHIDEP